LGIGFASVERLISLRQNRIQREMKSISCGERSVFYSRSWIFAKYNLVVPVGSFRNGNEEGREICMQPVQEGAQTKIVWQNHPAALEEGWILDTKIIRCGIHW